MENNIVDEQNMYDDVDAHKERAPASSWIGNTGDAPGVAMQEQQQ